MTPRWFSHLQPAPFAPRCVVLPPGCLVPPGSPELRVGRPFGIGCDVVSFEQFDRFCLATGRSLACDEGWGRGTMPAIHVSFADAQNYLRWLTESTGCTWRLPRGDEWEYAARAGSPSRFWWGDDLEPADANFSDTPGYGPFPTGSLAPNPWGLYNVTGNVAEWVDGEEESAGAHATRGGHWASTHSSLGLSVRGRSSVASNRVGFRALIEL